MRFAVFDNEVSSLCKHYPQEIRKLLNDVISRATAVGNVHERCDFVFGFDHYCLLTIGHSGSENGITVGSSQPVERNSPLSTLLRILRNSLRVIGSGEASFTSSISSKASSLSHSDQFMSCLASEKKTDARCPTVTGFESLFRMMYSAHRCN